MPHYLVQDWVSIPSTHSSWRSRCPSATGSNSRPTTRTTSVSSRPCEPCRTTFNRGGRHSALMTPLRITGHSIACPAGIGVRELAAAFREGRSGLRPNDFGESPLPTWIGRVPGVEAVELPGRLADWDCRNNRLAWLAL